MKDTVTLKELVAIALRRGKLILLLGLVFAVLLGVVHAAQLAVSVSSEENSPEKIEERYQRALETYEIDKKALEEQLDAAQHQLKSQEDYNAESLLMKIDPYDKSVTTINFAITDIDEDAFQQVFRLESTPIDYIISKIQSQYIVLWNSLDLEKALSPTSHTGMEDKYLQEVITLEPIDGGCFELTAWGLSKTESQSLAKAAYNCLVELQSVVSEGSYLHSFAVLSNVTKSQVDAELGATQQTNLENIKTYSSNIERLTQKLADLQEPEREEQYVLSNLIKSVIKYTILGLAMGIVIGFAWVLSSYIFRNRMETSRDLEQGISVPFLGACSKPGDFWNRWADKVLGERVWTDEAQALAYITANAKAHLPQSGDVLLTSTLPFNQMDVEPIMKAIEMPSRAISFVGNACRAPEVLEALHKTSCVILVEKIGISRKDTIQELASLVKNLDKTLVGFIIV